MSDEDVTAANGKSVRIGEAVLTEEFATELVGRVLWKQTDTVRTLPQRDEVAEAIVRWLVALSTDDEYAAAVTAACNGRNRPVDKRWCLHCWTWPFRSESSKHGRFIKRCVRCGKVEGAWT